MLPVPFSESTAMDIASLAVIFLAIGLGAISKGATGMGMPLIAIPIMTAFLGLQHSIAVLVVPILVSNAWQAWRLRGARHDARLGFLIPMLVLCGLGVVLGTWFLTTVPERGLTLTLGALLVGYLVLRLARPQLAIGPQTARKWAVPAGLGTGLLHGATGISAPIGVTFIHAMRLGRDVHVFAISVMFLVLGAVQAPALWVAGILHGEELTQGILALLPTFLLMPVGQWLGARLSPAAFDRLILAFLGLIGMKMLLGL